jgi:hypothetical protein
MKKKKREENMLPTIKIRFERWRFNKDYGVWVSTHGRFRNRDKADLPVKINQKGYCCIKVDCTTCSLMLAHRLVMLTWRPTDEAESLTVDHKDHNKRNNALDNLEWVSFEENQSRARADEIQEPIIHDTVINIAQNPRPNKAYKCVGFNIIGTQENNKKYEACLSNHPDAIQFYCNGVQGYVNNFKSSVFKQHLQDFTINKNTSGLKKYCGFIITPIWEN